MGQLLVRTQETYYSFQLSILVTLVIAIAELALAIALTVLAFDDTKQTCTPGGSDLTAVILLIALVFVWLPPLLRLFQILYASGLFMWTSLIGMLVLFSKLANSIGKRERSVNIDTHGEPKLKVYFSVLYIMTHVQEKTIVKRTNVMHLVASRAW